MKPKSILKRILVKGVIVMGNRAVIVSYDTNKDNAKEKIEDLFKTENEK